jgi:PqqD family protein of HPr-rel-A system
MRARRAIRLRGRPRQHPDVLTGPGDGGLVLYDTRVGAVHVLNGAAAAVWARCDGTRTADRIVSELLVVFDVAREALSADVRATLSQFRARRLLE